jgi:hypothetical protein
MFFEASTMVRKRWENIGPYFSFTCIGLRFICITC